MNIRYSLAFLFFYFFISGVFANTLKPDSILEAGIRKITNNYIESFTISGVNGKYNPHVEQRFLKLFSEDAKHFNYIPGSMYYLSSTGLKEYCKSMEAIYQNRAIYPGISDYTIEEVLKSMPRGPYLAKVSFINELIIYYDDFDQGIDTLQVALQLEIFADLQSNTFEIISATSTQGNFFDLSFRLLKPNREAASNFMVIFSYLDPTDHSMIRRTRHSDESGMIKISTIPAESVLNIIPPSGYAFVFEEEKKAVEWSNIPENDRILFVEPYIIPTVKRRFMIQIGAHNLVNANNFKFINETNFLVLNQGITSNNQQGLNMSFGYQFIFKENFALAAGTGINYSITDVGIRTDHIFQHFSGMTDVDDDIFELRLLCDNIKESYNFQSIQIPLYLTFVFKTHGKFISALNFTANISYEFVHYSTYESLLTQTTKGYYPKYNVLLSNIEDSSYQFNTVSFSESNPLTGKINQDHILSYGMQISINTPLIHDKIFINSRIGYQFTDIGNRIKNIEYPFDINETYQYIPTLSFGQHSFGVFRADLGLLFTL